MVMLEAIALVGLVAVLAYVAIAFLTTRLRSGPAATQAGRWRVVHYDKDRRTRVVLQRVSTDGGRVLDEHLVEAIDVADPAYDERFLTAMATARQRLALFESEE